MGVGIRDWGMGIRDSGLGNGDSRLGNGESGMGIGDSGIMNTKRAVKNGHHFFTALFYIPYQLVRDLMGAGIFPPRLMNSSARNLLISRTGA